MATNSRTLLALVLVFSVVGCKFIPPSEKEVKGSLEAVMRGFESVTFNESMHADRDAASETDVSFGNENESVYHEAKRIVLAQKELSFAGVCSIDRFEDYDSGLLISGTMQYHFTGPIWQKPNRVYAKISGQFTLNGGKVETLDFSIIQFEDGTRKVPKLIVNGKDFEFVKAQELFGLLQQGLRVTGATN